MVGEHRAEARELLGQPVEGVDRGVPARRGAAPAAGQARQQPAHRPPVRGEQPLDVARQRFGQAQQPQRLRGGPAVDDDDLPRPRLGGAPHFREREQVLDAGEHGQLVGHQLVDARPGEHGAQVLLQRPPRVVEQGVGVDVGGVQPALQLGGLAVELGFERVAEGVRGVGRDDQRLASRTGEAGGRGRRERRLADAALSREQHDPHGRRLLVSASTRRFSPLSAVSMITFSALRRSMPIIGMLRSTASGYVTSVESPLPASAYEPCCAFCICPGPRSS